MKKNWRFWLGTILIAWAAIFIVGRIFPPTQAPPAKVITETTPARVPEQRQIGMGDTGAIISGAPVVMLSTTKDGYDDISTALVAKDTVGLRNLVLTGRAFAVKAGTKAKVIDLSFTLRRVRILDGNNVDAAGWLPFEYVR